MNVVIGSAFRNSTGYLSRYFTQAATLSQVLANRGWSVRVHAVEGDSVDGTRAALERMADVFGVDVEVTPCTHGQRWFGSTEEPDRLLHLSKVGNAILDGVSEHDDALVYVESDLIWDPRTIESLLLAHVNESEYDSLSPLTMAGKAFYDIWGFRGLDGVRWSPHFPYHEDVLKPNHNSMVEVGSAGSCHVMKAELARDRRCRMTNGCLVEFCNTARSHGYRFAASLNHRINHP